MSLLKASNNAVTTLAAGISNTATNLSVVSGGGALFPALVGQQYFRATLIKNGNPAIFEIVKVLGRSTDTFTVVVRGQEGTAALAWNAGDTVTLLPTAADLSDFVQFDDLQEQLGNYAVDVGTANTYSVTLNPELTSHIVGMPIRWKAAHSNTGASTFNDGAGAGALIAGNAALPAGAVLANGIYESVWDGAEFQLLGIQNLAAYALTSALAAYAPLTTLAAYALLASPAFTGNPTAPTQPQSDSSTKLATTAYANAAGEELYTTGIPGSVTYPNGFIENWGVTVTPGSSPTVIAFQKPFTAKVFRIHAFCLNTFQELFADYPYTSLTGFTLNFGATGQDVAWSAIGY